MMKNFKLYLILALCLSGKNFSAQTGIDTLTTNGAWCWFADPRALYYQGDKEQTYFSWVTTEGDIVIASYNHESAAFAQNTLSAALQADDHANPAIFIRKDGRVILFYSKHFDTVMRYRISKNPEDISSFGPEQTFGNNVTYPYPFQVGGDIVIFYRGDSDWHPTMAVSHDNGATFETPWKFITGGGQRPYTRYCQSADGSIHVAFTTGHPRNEASNKIYYACYKNGAFYRADGTLIKNYTGSSDALNIDTSDAETVYDASNGKGWIWDIAVDADGHPVMVYAAFPNDSRHDYYYARWNGTSWDRHFIVNSGKWFPQTPAGASEPEPNYSGGLYLDPSNPSVVYLSKQVNGVFEIFKYTTADHGATWVAEAITQNTPSNLVNVRPVVPRNHKPGCFDVIWMRGAYVYYGGGQYYTSLVYRNASTGNRTDSITLDRHAATLIQGREDQLSATVYPFLASNVTSGRTITWTSSDESVATVENGQIIANAPGAAVIKAATDGLSDSCLVRVNAPGYVENAFFDFGTDSSPVAAGAIRVTENTLLGDSYGWITAVYSRDRGTVWNDEERDFNMFGGAMVFRVYVPNGKYNITVKQGDKDYTHDKMTLKVNETVLLNGVTADKGEILTNTFYVETDQNKLDFEFSRSGSDPNWVVNSIRIEKSESSGIAGETPDYTNGLPTQAGNISIYNTSGSLVSGTTSEQSDLDKYLDREKLPAGIYLVSYKSGDKVKSKKYVRNP